MSRRFEDWGYYLYGLLNQLLEIVDVNFDKNLVTYNIYDLNCKSFTEIINSKTYVDNGTYGEFHFLSLPIENADSSDDAFCYIRAPFNNLEDNLNNWLISRFL